MRIELRPARQEDIPALWALWQEAFGDDDRFLEDFFALGFAPERSRVLTAEGRPVSALYWFDGVWGGGRFAYLYAVATEKASRGRGYSSRLLEDTCAHLQKAGYDGALLVPGEKGLFDFYGRLGFLPCCPMETRPLPQGEGPFEALTPAEYESRREEFRAPGDGVLTGAALRFFARIGQFFACPDGVAAVHSGEDGKAFVMESFGAVCGETAETIRGPGGKDFAMFRPLGGHSPAPATFFMALD